MGFNNCLKAIESLWGYSLLFTIKSPVAPSTHLIDPGGMKGEVDLEIDFEAIQWFWNPEHCIGDLVP